MFYIANRHSARWLLDAPELDMRPKLDTTWGGF
jgi:hypothetical protein